MANATRHEGIQFPLIAGNISTTVTGKNIFSSAIKTISPRQAEAIVREKNWRKNYIKHVAPITTLAIQSGENALKIANAGLEAVYQNFEFHRNGKVTSLTNAMTSSISGRFHTAKIIGSRKQEAKASYCTLQREKSVGQRTEKPAWGLGQQSHYGTIPRTSNIGITNGVTMVRPVGSVFRASRGWVRNWSFRKFVRSRG